MNELPPRDAGKDLARRNVDLAVPGDKSVDTLPIPPSAEVFDHALQQHELEGNPSQPHDELTAGLRPKELESGRPSEEDDRIQLVVSGVTGKAERQSVLVSAEKEFDRGSAAKGGRFKKFLRNIVRHDLGREFLMFRGRKKAQDTIEETHRLYDMGEEEWQTLSAESIQRVLDDRQVGEMMDINAGESQKKLETNEGQAIRSVINGLVAEYVNNYDGNYDTDEGKQSLQQEMRRQLAELAKDNPEVQGLLGEGEAYMSNITDIAEAVRQRVDHEHGVDEVLKKVDLITARLDPGARTVLRETKTTKAFDAIAKMGGLNGTVIASGAAILYGAAVVGGKFGLKWGAKAGLGIPIAGSLMAGAISAFQEKSRLAHESTQVQREEELGYKGAKETKRRTELKDLLNNMTNATVLAEALRQHKQGEEGNEQYEVSDANFNELLLAAVGASARRDLSSEKERAFVSYSGETEAENAAERRALFLETVRARSALRRHYETEGLAGKNGGIDFDEFYETRKYSFQESLLREAANKDEQYASYSTKRALLKGAMTTGAGLLIGAGISEASSYVSDEIKGLGEAIGNTNFGASAKTVLAATYDTIKSHFSAIGNIPQVTSPTFVDHSLPSGGNLHIDDKLNFVDHGSTVSVEGPNGIHIDGLEKDPNGTLTHAAQDKLKAAGIQYGESTREVPVKGGGVEHQKVNAYAREHGTKVDRSWWDNNTGRTYEGSPYLEQSLQLSQDAKGNFVYSMKINEDAIAFHGKENANLKSGTFKMAFSLTKESQSTPVIVDMERHGDTLRAVIKPNNPLHSLFTAHENGHDADFKGKYAELVQKMGDRDHDGRLDIRALATDTGPGSVKTLDVPADGEKLVGDMTMYLKDERIMPLADLSDTGEPMTLYIYPPYRTGLREADNEESPRDGVNSPAPVPPANSGGPSTELEVRPRSDEVPPPTLPAQDGGNEGAPQDETNNVRNVNFTDKPSNFEEGARRIRQEQMDAERERWRAENERLRQEAEARAAESARLRKEAEDAAKDAREKLKAMSDRFREAHADGGGTNSPQQNGSPRQARQGSSGPKNGKTETPEQRKRRIDQEEGIRARENGAPIPEELQHTEAYRDAADNFNYAKDSLQSARQEMAAAIRKGLSIETLQEIQRKINKADKDRLEAKRDMADINRGKNKTANAQARAARRRKNSEGSSRETKAAA